MQDVYSFALSADGQQLAVGDGPELLVYRYDGEPVYKQFCDGILVGVGFCGPHLATADSEGRVLFLRALDGHRVEEIQLEGNPLGVFTSPDGALGVITVNGPVLVESNGQVVPYPLQDLAVAAFGPDRTSLGLGTHTGYFVAMDGMSGAAWGQIELGEPVRAVSWNHQGFWMVLVGRVLLRIDGGATTILGRDDLDGEPIGLAVSSDGALAALLHPGGRVELRELNTHTSVGEIVFRREVHGVDFGRSAQLGFGLDDGDASLVDLITRNTLRTEPHPGRGRNNWNVDLDYDAARVRAAVTLLRSGGQGPEQQFAPDDIRGGRRGCWGIGCMVMNVLLFATFGCIGLAFMVKYLL